MITPLELLKFTDIEGEDSEARATIALTTAEAYVDAYTRGNHTRGGHLRAGIEAVIITVASRILSNPEQISVREEVGPYVFFKGPGFNGFTLVELAVLNRYRKRATG